jgi:hypothetical protein
MEVGCFEGFKVGFLVGCIWGEFAVGGFEGLDGEKVGITVGMLVV